MTSRERVKAAFAHQEMEQAENFPVVSDEMVEFYKQKMAIYCGNNRAIKVSPGYFGLGDANNIPGPNLKKP